MTDQRKEDARTRFLQGAEEVLERANTDEQFGIAASNEIRQITEWQAEMLEHPEEGSADEYERRFGFLKRLSATGS